MITLHIRDKSRKLIIQFAKYMVGGGLYFWVGYIVFAIFYSGLHLNWLWSKMIADVIGWTMSYLVQRYWAFDNKKLKLHEMKHVERYVLITAVNFALDYSIIAGLKHIGITPYIGFFISSGFFTIWNYLWYRFWVFTENGATI